MPETRARDTCPGCVPPETRRYPSLQMSELLRCHVAPLVGSALLGVVSAETSENTPRLGAGRFVAQWKCKAGHEWTSIERIFGGPPNRGGKPSAAPRIAAPTDADGSRRCAACDAEGQKRLFASAARSYYSRAAGGPQVPSAEQNAPSAEPSAELSPDAECQRVLALPASAPPTLVLGLGARAADCPADEARRRYRRLARLLHPDKCDLPRAEEAFKRVQSAWLQFDHGAVI